jgi:hypothetical protein
MTEAITTDPRLKTATALVTASSSTCTVTSTNVRSSATVPAFIAAGDAYYWSFQWQSDVRESMAALAAGDYEDFDSNDPNEVSRWLFKVDED